jgi:ribosomal protein S27E
MKQTIPAEETAPCPHCGKQAVVIDVNVTACLNCGRTIRKANGRL